MDSPTDVKLVRNDRSEPCVLLSSRGSASDAGADGATAHFPDARMNASMPGVDGSSRVDTEAAVGRDVTTGIAADGAVPTSP